MVYIMARTADSTHARHVRRTGFNNPMPGGTNGNLTAAGGPYHFEIGGSDDLVTSVQIRWFDDTSNATIAHYTCNLPVSEVAVTSTSAADWVLEPTVVVGPTGAAAGSSMLHLSVNGAKRNKLVVTPSANTEMEIISHGVN